MTQEMFALWKRTEVAVLHEDPLVLVTFEKVFAANLDAFRAEAKRVPKLNVLLQIGGFPDPPEVARPTSDAAAALKREFPNVRVVVLANDPKEVEIFNSLGTEAIFCNHNAFLDERRTRAFRVSRKRFDAVYLARMSPFKRHGLMSALDMSRSYLLGMSEYQKEHAYVEETLKKLPGITIRRSFPGLDVSRLLAQAVCGVALSAKEGAMFASAEYLLSGLPIVNTPSLGGREWLFPEGAFVNVEDTPEAVAEGVRHWVEHPADPAAVRAGFLAKAEPHRERLRALLNEMIAPNEWKGRFPHKLGIRTPRNVFRCNLLVQIYLFGQWLKVKFA